MQSKAFIDAVLQSCISQKDTVKKDILFYAGCEDIKVITSAKELISLRARIDILEFIVAFNYTKDACLSYFETLAHRWLQETDELKKFVLGIKLDMLNIILAGCGDLKNVD